MDQIHTFQYEEEEMEVVWKVEVEQEGGMEVVVKVVVVKVVVVKVVVVMVVVVKVVVVKVVGTEEVLVAVRVEVMAGVV